MQDFNVYSFWVDFVAIIILAVLSLPCCTWASLVAASGGYTPAAVRGILTAVASLGAELGL